MDDFEKLPKMAGWHEGLLVPTSQLQLSTLKPNHNITIHNRDGEVARLDFNGPELKFTGNADEGAKIFIDFVSKCFDERLKEEYQRGYNDAKKENT